MCNAPICAHTLIEEPLSANLFIYLFIFAKMCLRNIALKKKITNLLADKLITIMVFVQFCDIKNLANFSQKH
jgi:hypothetical protein